MHTHEFYSEIIIRKISHPFIFFLNEKYLLKLVQNVYYDYE